MKCVECGKELTNDDCEIKHFCCETEIEEADTMKQNIEVVINELLIIKTLLANNFDKDRCDRAISLLEKWI